MTKEEYVEKVFSEVDHLPSREAIGRVLEYLLGEVYELRAVIEKLSND